jgi:SAM-dependent methyltransferase
MDDQVMGEWSLSSFESPSRHAAIAEIIQRRSTNQADVREVALDGLDLSKATNVLDLGCGFGFMSEALVRRFGRDARIIGVDACATNEQPYLERVAGACPAGSFVCQRIDTRLDWPDDSFDLIVASYSLYFFPEVIADVARVLTPRGLFIALTHAEQSCRGLLCAVGGVEIGSPQLPVSRNFSAENGSDLLTPWFDEVERVEYRNSLVFEAAEQDDLRTYLRFKLPFLSPASEPGSELPEPLWQAVQTSLARQGRVVLPKNDAVFRCRKPRCR